MIEEDGRRTTLQLPPLPAPLHLLAGVMAWEALSWREKLSVVRVGTALAGGAGRSAARAASTAAADVTVRQWLVSHGQAARLIQLFWEPLALAALNQSIDDAAATTFVEVLGRMFGPDADRASLLVPSVPLDDLYAEPSRAWLEARGATVRTRATARILFDGDRVSGVDVRGERLAAPFVICAAPWFALGETCASAPAALADLLSRASATSSSPIVTVNLWYDRPVVDEMILGLPGRVFQWVFDKGAMFQRDGSHLSLVSSGAEHVVGRSNAELIELGVREVTGAFPGARPARLLHASAVRERQATFSLAPGQPRRPGTETPVQGLLLAGDWVDTGLPATIESAVLSGHRAAAATERLARSLRQGRPRSALPAAGHG
jgi:squalene-associated FAD-dependent desaturase